MPRFRHCGSQIKANRLEKKNMIKRREMLSEREREEGMRARGYKSGLNSIPTDLAI